MRKIINSKMYDTDTASLCGSDSYSNPRDFSHWSEKLYRKKTGEYFLWGEGGPMSRYAVSSGQNETSGGQEIRPMTEAEARGWAEVHMDADDYIATFGEVDE